MRALCLVLALLVPISGSAAQFSAAPPFELRSAPMMPTTELAAPSLGQALPSSAQAAIFPVLAAPANVVSPQAQLSAAAGQPAPPSGPTPDAGALQRKLYDGERVYAPEASYQTLDDKTVNDLDLTTPASGLYSIVRGQDGPTVFGDQRLKWMLTHPSQDVTEIRKRQDAVAELSANAQLRGTIDAAFGRLGRHGQAPLRDHLLGEPEPLKGPVIVAHLLQALLIGLATAIVISSGARALPQMAIVLMMMSSMPMKTMTHWRKELGHYKSVFALAREVSGPLSRSGSPMLQDLGRALAVDDSSRAGPGLSGLSGTLRRTTPTPLIVVADFAWFHGMKTLPYVLARVKAKRAELTRLFGAVGELDALRSLSAYGENLGPLGTKPVLKESAAPSLSIKDGHHPFLAAKGGSIGNDVSLDLQLDGSPAGKSFGVLTGSNMGGKSTYLRMAALLSLLAQTGALVPAAAHESTVLKILSSIDIRDHLASGKSLYDAETDRILALIREAEKGGYFMVMDEILQGTNPTESSAAQWAVVRHLVKTNNLFFLATHNPKVTDLSEIEPKLANFHVEETVKDGKMSFSHKVLPGPATSRNGLQTLETKGFPRDIVDEARRVADSPTRP